MIQKDQINNLKKDSEVLVLQVRTISKKRLSKKIGNITKDQVEQIKQGIALYLNY
ncbi:MAG: type II toxin-antitoxin system PemK/MazF family toxin [Chitinophagaceae bacterium]